MSTPTTAKKLGAIAVSAAFLLAGCASSPDTPASADNKSTGSVEDALSTPTDLVFWTWIDVSKPVELFMEKYPEINVEVVNVGDGADQYKKVRAALQSGKGFPDVFQLGYDYVGSFRQTESLLDLSPYGAGDLANLFTDAAWNQVADDEGIWAIPQDSGPIGYVYRNDIFAKAGLDKAPETWDEFADYAQTIKSKTDSYITNVPGNDMPNWLGFFWQAGVQPFSYDGGTEVGINLDSPEAQEVIKYWENLVKKDLVSVMPDFTDEFYQGLSSEAFASWVVPAYGPSFLQGTVADTSGNWTAAEMPQWEAGQHISGNWGGSTNAVTAASPNPVAAYELAKFINTEFDSTIYLANEVALFPTTLETLQSTDFTDHKSDFFGGQETNKLYAEIAENVSPDFQFLPFMDYVNQSFNETLGTAISERGDMMGGLTAWQEDLVKYAEQQGFTVK